MFADYVRAGTPDLTFRAAEESGLMTREPATTFSR